MVPPSGFSFSSLSRLTKLTLGPAAIEHAKIERRDAGRIIAAVFQPLQCIHKQRRNLLTPDNSNDPAHKQLQYPE